MKIQPVRGTHDIYGQQLYNYKIFENVINKFAQIYDFKEIITPIFEFTDLFKKPLGENSDVVLKEMYTFLDRNDSSLTLRPEYTTPMIRAAISNNFLSKLPQKLYGIGPMFRRERPQKGRYRQFNQMNFEVLGSNDILADVDLILLAQRILKELFFDKKIELHINSLGDKNTLLLFKEALNIYFNKFKRDLSDESLKKIITNPLRILDSKHLEDQEICKNAPQIFEFYSKEASEKFLNIQKYLSNLSIDFKIDSSLVRGLDYYCHTVFEFKTNDLGSQGTLIGGGRYDGLIKTLGGPDIPGVGWAGGVERILMLMENSVKIENKTSLILMSENYKEYGLVISNELRKNNIEVHFDYKYNLKKSLSSANQLGLENVIIIGENEVKENICTLKNLKKNSQKKISIDNLIKELI